MGRVKTGIPGLDELVEGGVPEGFNLLLTGCPGSGKTIFGMQYLYNGAKNGENGLYVYLGSSVKVLKDQAMEFGWDLESLEKERRMAIIMIPLDKPRVNLFDMLEEETKEIGAKRLVFDSLTTFSTNIDQFAIPLEYAGAFTLADSSGAEAMKKDKGYRYEVMPTLEQDPKGRVFYKGTSEKRVIYLLLQELSKLGTTNVIIADENERDSQLTADGVSEFACDGLIRLRVSEEKDQDSLNILKMRLTNINRESHLFSIGKAGISLG